MRAMCECAFMRTTIDLPDSLYRTLKARAALEGLPMKDLVRRLVERGLAGVPVGVSAAVNPPLFAGEVPQSMWRFSSFGEINRLFFACAVASAVSAAVAIGLGLVKAPRAVPSLHPVVSMTGLVCALVRVAHCITYV